MSTEVQNLIAVRDVFMCEREYMMGVFGCDWSDCLLWLGKSTFGQQRSDAFAAQQREEAREAREGLKSERRKFT